jgi:NADH-quinone oxidoreductase subunit J
MVLFLFVIMMLDVRKEAEVRFVKSGFLTSLVVLLVLFAQILFLLMQSTRLQVALGSGQPISEPPSVESLSLLLFQSYLLPFEVASVILLVALIGAVILARSNDDDNGDDEVRVSQGAER